MNFVGHQETWKRLSSEISRLPPAYLFYGLPGIGKSKVAHAWAQWVFCTQRKEFACNTCENCQRFIALTHPDFFYIDGSEERIKIESIRELFEKIKLAPLSAEHKIVLIDQAQELTTQAANSLLKVLEEPPPQTLFILIAPNLIRLLPTIRSRCRKIYFQSPAWNEASTLLEEYPKALVEKAWSLCQGSVGLVKKVLEEDLLEKLDLFFSQNAGELAEEKENLDLILDLSQQKIFNDCIEHQNWEGIARIDAIRKAGAAIDRNANKALVLENLLYK